MTNEIFWIVAILLFVILEASTATVVCIWFAGGTLVALLSCAMGASLKVQLFLFLLVSVLLVVFLRKIAFFKKNLFDTCRSLARTVMWPPLLQGNLQM